MASKKKDYFGLGRLLSIILAIIPVTSLILGIVTRFQEKKFVAAILRLVLGWNIIWVLDLILMIFTGKILRLINFYFLIETVFPPHNFEFSFSC